MPKINPQIIIFFFSLTMGLTGCGIKGPPLPPLPDETIQKQKISTDALPVNEKLRAKPKKKNER